MMKIVDFSIKQPVATWMLFLSLVMLGSFSAYKLPVDMLPNIEPPVVTVITTWKGANADDIETEITEPIEDVLSAVNNLDTIESRSLDNLSLVSCRFEWGTNLDTASGDIRDKIEFVKPDLPEDSEPPKLFKFSSSMAPVLTFSITAEKSWPALYRITDSIISERIKRIPGVGAILLYGGKKRRINIFFDKEKISALNLDISEINRIIEAENVNIPGGRIKSGKYDYFLRIPGRFKSAWDIENILIKKDTTGLVFLKDIARVEDSFEPQNFNAWGDGGKPGIVMMVQKQTGKNTVEIIDKIYNEIEKIKKNIPEDIKIDEVANHGKDIKKAISNLKSALFLGIFFIVIVNLFFLRNLKIIITTSLVIPVSLLISMLFLYMNKNTLNMVSMMALAISSGMVVDNAIVVIENIMKYKEQGYTGIKASLKGTKEVGLAITASTMTTVIVFVPLIFLGGLAGILFNVLGFVIVVTLFASLATALMFIPMTMSRILEKDKGSNIKPLKFIFKISEKLISSTESSYEKWLSMTLKNRKSFMALITLFFLSGLSFIPYLSTSFFPDSDTGDLNIRFRLEEGTRVEETTRILKGIMEEINSIVKKDEIFHYYATDGKSDMGLAEALGFEQGSNIGQITFKLVDRDKRKRSVKEIASKLRERIKEIPGVNWLEVKTESKVNSALMGGGKPIAIEIKSIDSKKGENFARKLIEKLKAIDGLVDIDLNQRKKRPEIHVLIDRLKASSLGLTQGEIALKLRNFYYGITAGRLVDSNKRFDIVTRLEEGQKNNMDIIMDIPITTRDKRIIRLGEIASISEKKGPVEIKRKDRQRVVVIEADIYKRSLGDITTDIKEMIKKTGTPPGISISFGSDVKEQKKVFKDLIMLLLMGVILVFMIMASLFRNYRDPFIVMFSIPFAFTGIFYVYYFTGCTLGMMSFMGVIMLMGIVVNNAIVLIDHINQVKSEKKSDLMNTVIIASKDRLRPVLMTTLTTILGMLPMAISKKVGSENWNPLGITMVGGLSVSSFVTLFLIPFIWYMLEKKKSQAS